jgi:hypothetical protein
MYHLRMRATPITTIERDEARMQEIVDYPPSRWREWKCGESIEWKGMWTRQYVMLDIVKMHI